MLKNPTQEELMNKWSAVLGPLGMTGSQLDTISQLLENQANFNPEENKTPEFPSLLPMATKVASQLVSNQILGFASEEEIDEVKKKVQSENRDSKIQSITEGSEYVEKKVEDDEEYKKLMKKGVQPLSTPQGVLCYLDYQYASDQKPKKKTRRAGKKHKK
jgi:hypothetical protein